MSAVFHLNNKEAKCELIVNHNNEILPICSESKYLVVALNRSPSSCRHLESLHKKLTSCVSLLMLLLGSGCGAGVTTLRTAATLSLVDSTAEFCAPFWCRSAHTRLIDLSIKDVLQIVTGCLRPTLPVNLPILTGIQPAEIHRKETTLSLARRAMKPGNLLHSALTCLPIGMNGVSNRDPHLCPPHNSSSIHLTTTSKVRPSWGMTDGMRSGWTTLRDSVLSFPTPASTLLQ